VEARAQLKYVRLSPRKVRLVVDLVRGKTLSEARQILQFVPNRSARHLTKLLKSAASNAAANHEMDRDVLRVTRAYVDQGPSLKRWQPVSRGMAHAILKKTCHITVCVAEDEKLAREKAAAQVKKGRGRRRSAAAGKARKPAGEPKGRPAKRGGRKPKGKEQGAKGEPQAAGGGDDSGG
jgi:large subunit ribosomal protein L22